MTKQDNLSKMFYKDTIQGDDKAPINGEPISDDPRIDSPEIEVIYPLGEMVKSDTTKEESEPVAEKPTPSVEVTTVDVPTQQVSVQQAPDNNKKEEPHECKMSLQAAAKEHWLPLTIFGLAVLGIGFGIGRIKPKS